MRGAVPLFLMCSGALMLSEERTFSYKKLFLKTIPRMVIAMVFWAMVYKIWNLYNVNEITLKSLWQAFKEVLLFKQEYHFYYMHIILLVYFFLPVTRAFVKNASKRDLEYFLGVWFVLAIVYPTLYAFYPFNLFGGMIPQWMINMTYASVGYGILGYYLRKYPAKMGINAVLSAVGYITVFFGTYLLSAKQGYLNETFFAGTSVGVVMLAAGVYGICMGAERIKSNKIKSVLASVSKASFCIYLVHVFFISLLGKYGITSYMNYPIVTLPLLTAAIFSLSYAVYFVISKIPVLNKWII